MKRKAITLKNTGYQPSMAELKRKVIIKSSPEELAKAVVQNVDVKFLK